MLKQFTYVDLKVFVTVFQKIIWPKDSPNPNIRSNSLCSSGLFWTSFSFLQVNQEKRVGMVSTNNV